MKPSALLLAAVIAFLPALSHGLGLGRIKIHSALNEPLNAEIEFTSITEKELKGLSTALATRAEFDTAGIDRLPYLATIKFVVAKRLDGRHVLQLTTEQPIDEPFLHLLLQVEWAGGRLVREYSALIDPPSQIIGKPAGIEAPAVAPPAVEAAAAAPAPTVVIPPEAAETAKPETRAEDVVVTVEPPAAEERKTEPPQAAPAPAVPPAPAETAAAGEAAREPLFGPANIAEGTAPDLAPKIEPLAPSPVAEAEPKAVEPATPPAPAEVAVAKPSADWAKVSQYAVKKGDTMWEIAERVRADRAITVEQVVLAIYRANRGAFFGNNVNNLHAGKILKMPEREDVGLLPADMARLEFRAQYDVWQEYKLKLASASQAIKVEAPAAAAATPPVAEEPAKTAKAPAPPVAGKQPTELLKIVRSNLQGEKGTPDKKVAETESAKDAKERQALAERVTTLEESLVSKQIEAKDLGGKIGAVRAQLKREARLIEIESQQLADAQRKPQPAAEAPAKAPPAPAPEAAKPAATPKIEVPAAEPPKAAAEPAEPVTVKKPTAPKPAVPPPAPVEEKGFMADLLESILGGELMFAVLGGVAAIAGAIGFLYWRRRRKAIGEFEESILSSDVVTADSASSMTTTSDTTSGQVPASGDTSFLSDFSQGGMGDIRTDEVDPVAEAEVYLAYGRDETAEEILKDAIVKHPERHELQVKLLEIYHQRNDVRAFETVAEEFYAALGGRRDKSWEKVEEMGRKLNPDNPMFRGGAPAKRGGPAAAMPAAGLGETQRTRVVAPPAGVMAESETSLDFDLGAEEATPAAVQAESGGIDFDLGGPGGVEPAPASLDFEPAAKSRSGDAGVGGLESLEIGKPGDNLIDFELGGGASVAEAEEGAPQAGGGGIDFSLDLGGRAEAEEAMPQTMLAEAPAPAEAAGQQWDETATKLDLAKAYIDMGDAEGARSILDEVMAEGNDSQKKQAKELAAQLG